MKKSFEPDKILVQVFIFQAVFLVWNEMVVIIIVHIIRGGTHTKLSKKMKVT